MVLVLSPLQASADDRDRLATLFDAAAAQGGLVTIPPGDYQLDGLKPIPMRSGMTVTAYGARFHLPESLGDRARCVLFAGENVSDFRWSGGHFAGHVFDPARDSNSWEPNANTRAILITTSRGGETRNLHFRDISSSDLAGAAITVQGAEKPGSDREIDAFARESPSKTVTWNAPGS